ncbi:MULTISPECIES: nucleotidyltransferase-like protein [Sporosarcina]|uniref:Nucleotidyltransferase-like protein n=1 Tax=Sporosarcina contaminans TaxID=633403 RepID=A0ABW3TX53_9BACL
MEQILRPIYQERASSPETLGVILVEKRDDGDPITDTFDEILLIITSNDEVPIYTKHYTDGEGKAAMHVINEKQLRKWLLLGTRRKVVDWLFYGKIFFDRNEFVEGLKNELKEYPFYGRKIKMGIELARLVRAYMEGKNFFEQKNYMDAYHHAIQSLHYLARLTVIEKGFSPEVTVWAQVKRIDPAIYKLYEELIMSEEPLEKKLKLLFLASEFFIHNRTADGAQHILEVMETKEHWTIQELHEHEELRMYSIDLENLVEFLIEKGFIQIVQSESKNELVFHRDYKVKQRPHT